MEQTALKTRYHLLDNLRGFAILCMVFYHGFFTVSMVLGLSFTDRLIAFFMPVEPFLRLCLSLSRAYAPPFRPLT